ncbi:MAG: response regulator transcription factor [Patescibacteria group bacterium]|nr:response regulator transcription factor [Patescibacteria group bacterium]
MGVVAVTMQEALSPREVEVLQLMAQGLTNREIREALVVAESTLATHLTHISEKLHLPDGSRARILVRALELGIVHVGHAHDWHEYRQCRSCGLVHPIEDE